MPIYHMSETAHGSADLVVGFIKKGCGSQKRIFVAFARCALAEEGVVEFLAEMVVV